ncbi:MAG: UDP-N-acetylmuramate--alanine ligase, partial [Lentisphaeria bacterium]|nr:UDP-N-acetylmuramate--alanine ligase [Lentisphaeria bacterium]
MHLHFIGAGGIGMSGLAAAFKDLGHRITGSDRGAANPENSHIIQPLKNAGVEIFPQDGSYIDAGTPDALVFSTAIEEDNPDFVSGKGIKRLHRSALLAELIAQTSSSQLSIAVTGSCGKSTVTAYLAEALLNIGDDPRSLNGAVSKRFVSDTCVGNYRGGKGR